MKQRHTRTPAKILIAQQLQQVRNTIQLLDCKHQRILSTVPQSLDEEAALQAIIASSSKLINVNIQEAEHLRQTIKTWDERQHSQVSFEETEKESLTALEIAESKINSLDSSINQRRSVLLELSATQRELRKVLPSQVEEYKSETQSIIAKNSVVLSSLQETIHQLRSRYDNAQEVVFLLRKA